MRKNLIAITLLVAAGFVALPAASAQSCDIPAFVKDFVKNLKEECKKLEGPQASTSTCTKKQAALLKLIDKWNGLVQNSPLKLSPRDTTFGQDQLGTVIAPGDRRFVSQPIEPGKGVTISVKKRAPAIGEKDTKGGCVVTVCAVDLDSASETSLASFTFESDAKVNTEFNKSFSASQVGNKVIIVKLDGKGLAARFPYTYRATKN
jgi:predicted secreted protein